MGSVYQRKSDGRWCGEVSRTNEDGSRQKRVVTAKTRAEVLVKLDEVRAAWKKSAPRIKRDSTMTVGRYLDGWLKTHKGSVAPSTWMHREQHVRNHIKPHIGQQRIGRLAVKHVEQMLKDIVAAGFSARTAGHVRATLRVALGEAVREGIVDVNVAMGARGPKVRQVEQKHLSAEDARTLIAATKGDELGPLWMLALTSGARAGELCGLSWGDIDLDAGQMHIRVQWTRGLVRYELRQLKTEQSRRVVPLTPEMVEVLMEMKSADMAHGWGSDSDPVFHDPWVGERLDPTRLAGRLKTALKAAGLPIVRFHDLRHSAASLMLASGVDIVAVSRVLGHSNVTTTLNTYGHTDDRARRKAVESLRTALSA